MTREISDRHLGHRDDAAAPGSGGVTSADRLTPADLTPADLTPAEERRRIRQQAGLHALIALSSHVSVSMSEAATIIYDLPPWPPDATTALESEEGTAKPKPATLIARLRTDTMVRNSLALMLSTGLQAALGFAFWIVMAHLFSASQVGTASSLLSACALIAYFALLGMNSTLVRFLPTSKNSNALITSVFLVVSISSAVLSLIYVLLIPLIAPRLAFIDHNPAQMLGFIVLTVASAINLLTDSVFLAARKAGYCALTDGAIGGISKIVAGVLLAGTGAFGLFSASIGGMAVAAVCSLVLIVTAFHWRPSLQTPFHILRPLLRFSGASYAANAFGLLPSLVVPVVVLDRLGPQAAAYYFVAFQIATLLYSAIWAVEGAFFAEGSQAGADWRAIRRRSRRLAISLFVPAGLILALTSHWVLLVFGAKYSQHATTTMELLAATVIPMAICNWSWTVLKLSGRLALLVFSNAVYAAGISGAAWVLASRGLVGVSAAWFVGASLAAVVATVPASIRTRKSPARHRMTRSAPRSLTGQNAGQP